ncbi:MAG TPA: hypothetical protein PKA00_14060 [Saprospiraceae bacterium]|nr:hypothetical protein [Saprospiraceae bacterium]HMQ84036.1 hypothetical protein [Saprospiraceae bacterium]
MPSLTVVISFVLIILFYSLLGTIVMELIASFLAMRANHLEKVLKSLLSSQDRREEILGDFKSNVVYQQLSGKFFGKSTPPSYLPSNTFRSILMNVLAKDEKGFGLFEKIESLPDENLKATLKQLLKEADNDLEAFKGKIETWYDDIMDRASGWYTRKIERMLLVLGLSIAIIFNVDTLTVFNRLSESSQTDLDKLVALAEATAEDPALAAAYDTLPVTADRLAQQELQKDIYGKIKTGLDELDKNSLGIGWGEDIELSNDIFFWLFKAFGWLITAVCISKGAPFWFDLLRKLVNFRSTGKLPEFNVSIASPPAAVVSTASKTVVVPQAPPVVVNSNIDIENIEKPVG